MIMIYSISVIYQYNIRLYILVISIGIMVFLKQILKSFLLYLVGPPQSDIQNEIDASPYIEGSREREIGLYPIVTVRNTYSNLPVDYHRDRDYIL